MAVNNLNFAATVEDWVKQTEQRMTAVFREATQRTVSLAQRRIPVDTGFARASVLASLQSMPPIQKGSTGEPGKAYGYDSGNITLAIARAEIGQTIYVGWTASYVGALENGHSKQAPSGFVGLAAQRWQITVNEVAEEAKARASRA